MAAATVQAPPLREYPVIPILARDAMAASKPYPATEKMNEALGFPGKLVDGWREKAVFKIGELLEKNRGLRVFLDACVHCGACLWNCAQSPDGERGNIEFRAGAGGLHSAEN